MGTQAFDGTDWARVLTPDQYRVLRQGDTEAPGTSALLKDSGPGTYCCAGCGAPLFDAADKFDSGTGWPSFHTALDGAVATRNDTHGAMARTEVLCARCDGHLGHVFPDGPPPTGLRYCINGVALAFSPADAESL